jgi:hypothetical protein
MERAVHHARAPPMYNFNGIVIEILGNGSKIPASERMGEKPLLR